MTSLLLCMTLTCPFTAELGLFWEPSPGADSYNIYISEQGSFFYLLEYDVPCGKLFYIEDDVAAECVPHCHRHPVRLFPDEAFPVAPGMTAIFAVSASNSGGESLLTNAVGIVSDQWIIEP